MSISWEAPLSMRSSGFIVFFAEFDPNDDFDKTPGAFACLGCLVEHGDEQLARGLDLARRHGQVDWDVDADEWCPA